MIYTFYTGSYALADEPGICLFRLDTEKQTLERLESFSGIHHPSYLCLGRECGMLYAVQEQVPEGMVHGLAVTETGLELRSSLSSGGADPCHLSMSSGGRALYAANYTGGSLAVYRLGADGSLKRRSGLYQHEGKGADPIRQECAHVHFSGEHEGLLYVTDLGLDQVFVYQERDGSLEDTGLRLTLPAGYGPRHLEFDPERPEMVYVLCELAGKVVVFQKEEGRYTLIQEADTLPADFKGKNISAAIKRSKDLLFTSNRGHDSIAVFRIRKDGMLTPTGIFPSGGKTPRDFEIFDGLLAAAHQDSDSLTVLKIDRERGALSLTDLHAELVKPCCICRV